MNHSYPMRLHYISDSTMTAKIRFSVALDEHETENLQLPLRLVATHPERRNA